MGRPHFPRPIQSVVQRVNADNPLRPQPGGQHRKGQADNPLPDHDHILAQQTAHLLHRIQDGSRGLAQHPLGQIPGVRQGAHPVGRGGDILYQSPRPHAPAGIDDDPLPFVKLLALAFHHYPGALVAGNAQPARIMFLRENMAELVPNIAAADRYFLQPNQALARRWSRNFRLHNLKLPGADQPGRFHLTLPSHPRLCLNVLPVMAE